MTINPGNASRRGLLQASGALMAAGFTGTLGALHARQARAQAAGVINAPTDSANGPVAQVPDRSTGDTELSDTFAPAWNAGALRMSRGEGLWYADGQMFIVDTSTGVDAAGRRGRGEVRYGCSTCAPSGCAHRSSAATSGPPTTRTT